MARSCHGPCHASGSASGATVLPVYQLQCHCQWTVPVALAVAAVPLHWQPASEWQCLASVLVLVRGSKHTWLGIQRRKRRALVRMESGKEKWRHMMPVRISTRSLGPLRSAVQCSAGGSPLQVALQARRNVTGTGKGTTRLAASALRVTDTASALAGCTGRLPVLGRSLSVPHCQRHARPAGRAAACGVPAPSVRSPSQPAELLVCGYY
jgi:hypothetical protein